MAKVNKPTAMPPVEDVGAPMAAVVIVDLAVPVCPVVAVAATSRDELSSAVQRENDSLIAMRSTHAEAVKASEKTIRDQAAKVRRLSQQLRSLG